jgi:hypothetical protein
MEHPQVLYSFMSAAQAVSYAQSLIGTALAPAETLNGGVTTSPNFTPAAIGTNPWPMGHLPINGTPSRNWTQSQAALQAETSALELLFSLRHSISSADSTWSSYLASGVSVLKWLDGTANSQLNVSEKVKGASLKGVTLSSSVNSNGNTIKFSLTATTSGSNLIVRSIKKLP